jgi:fructoselysine-6-P-deglycase FrlB-like protein
MLLGCGTSENAARGVAEQVEGALRAVVGPGRPVEVRQAFEAALDPVPGGVCVAISHEGESAATLQGLEAARDAGASTAAITAVPGSPIAAVAELALSTPALDRSWCHTVGYLSPLVVGGALAAALRGEPLDGEALARALADCLPLRARTDALAGGLWPATRLVACGSGLDRGAARELGIKLEEAAHLPTSVHDVETFLHGHLPSCDARTALVLLATEPAASERRLARGRTLLAAARVPGLRTAAIVAHDVELDPALTSAGVLRLPAAPGVPPQLAALATGALGLQLLTASLVHRAGTNPDRIRREDRAYREAAALAARL